MVPSPAGVTTYGDAKYRRRRSINYVIIAAFLCFMLWTMAKDATSVTIAYMGVVVIGLAFDVVGFLRCYGLGFTLDERGVTARTVWTTKTYPWEEIERAETVERSVHQGAFSAAIVPGSTRPTKFHALGVIWKRDGKRVAFHGLRVTALGDAVFNSFVDDAMRDADRIIKSRRGLGDG